MASCSKAALLFFVPALGGVLAVAFLACSAVRKLPAGCLAALNGTTGLKRKARAKHESKNCSAAELAACKTLAFANFVVHQVAIDKKKLTGRAVDDRKNLWLV